MANGCGGLSGCLRPCDRGKALSWKLHQAGSGCSYAQIVLREDSKPEPVQLRAKAVAKFDRKGIDDRLIKRVHEEAAESIVVLVR